MKISIVTPIFNEEKSIKRYFGAINKLRYPINDFEVVLINDGSSDNTLTLLKQEKKKSKLNLRIINLKKNQGRTIAREKGAKEAKYENILFSDCKCELFPDALKKIAEINYQPLSSNPLQKKKNRFDRFLYLIRKKFYGKLFEENFKDYFIYENNFDKTRKGTTAFFCDRNLFLRNQPKNKEHKTTSDDIKLLRNIVKEKAILKTAKVKLYYNTRQTFKENVKHLYNRGPKFTDYYYDPLKKWFWIINLIIIITIAFPILIVKFNIFLEVLIGLLAINTLIAIYLSINKRDFFISFTLFPICSLSFFIGIVKGVIIKPFKNE